MLWTGKRPLAFMLGWALLLRMGVACFGGYHFDLNAFEGWATFLATHPLSTFYTFSEGTQPDHLPGDVILLAALGRLFRWTVGVAHIDSGTFDWLLKMVAGVSDIIIGGCIYAIVRRLRPESSDRRALIAAAAWLFNPAVIFVSAFWGQWNAFSLALLMLATTLLVRGQIMRPWPLLAWACLVKPQLIVLAPLFLIFIIREHGPNASPASRLRLATRSLAGSGLGVLLVIAICAPFDVGLPGMNARWDLDDRVMFAIDRYTQTVAGAFNIWGFAKRHIDTQASDLSLHILGLTARTFSMILMTTALIACYLLCSRVRDPRLGLIWGSLGMTLTLYMLPTRIHERYLLPALPFAALLVAIPELGRIRWLIAGLTVPFFVSLYLAYHQAFPLLAIPYLHSHLAHRSFSAVLMLLHFLVGVTGLRLARNSAARSPAPRTRHATLNSTAD